MPNISWDAAEYKENFSFVPAYGEAVIGLITKQLGSRVIDLGCGNGSLTAHLADRGYLATGIDDSTPPAGPKRASGLALHQGERRPFPSGRESGRDFFKCRLPLDR